MHGNYFIGFEIESKEEKQNNSSLCSLGFSSGNDSRFCGFYSVFLKDVKSANRPLDRSQMCRQLALNALIVLNTVATLPCMTVSSLRKC